MTTTGYTDTFNRTVTNGLGSATSGQAYVLVGAATEFSVAPGVASIAVSALGNNYGLVDAGGSAFADVSGQVSLSSIPASNLAAAGFVVIGKSGGNAYTGAMMVATGGAMSLRFTRIFAGSTITMATVATGVTYVANTIYNLRFQAYWSRTLQTNMLSLKIWAVGAAEPGGWMATTQDNFFTDYTAGTQVGIYARDESSVLGTIIARYRTVAALSYHLPMPDAADTACADPAVAYPKQTALESLADATDAAVQQFADLADLAGLFPRVRVSNPSFVLVNQFALTAVFNALEFNVNTPTNLSYNPRGIQLSVGIWAVTFEAKLSSLSTNSVVFDIQGGSVEIRSYMRPWPSQTNDQGVNGTVHISCLITATDPLLPTLVQVQILPTNTATTVSISYMALSAIKVSDYFA